MLCISEQTEKFYCLVFDFDSLREKFLSIYRSFKDLHTENYYFSSFKGSVHELEILLDKNHAFIPKVIESFKNLERFYLYINDISQTLPEFNFQLKSLSSLKIFCYGSVRIPNIFENFPNLRFLDIYGDISGLTLLEVTDSSQEKLRKIRSNLKNVILIKLIPN